jgi:hypothetical protein
MRSILVLIFLFYAAASWAVDYADFGDAKKFDVPLREVSIIATAEGYYPPVVSIFEGEKVRIYFTTTLREPSCLLITEKQFYLSGKVGEIAEGELFFNKPGQFSFYCPAGKIKGTLTILQRPENKRQAVDRKIASEAPQKEFKVWRPREE